MKRNLLTALFYFISLSVSFSQVDLTNGLVAYYPFNGNADDASGNGNNAVFNNATLADDRRGIPNSAYSFNGIDNYIQIPNATSVNFTSQISLCAIVKPQGFNYAPCHGNSILMKGDADNLPGNYLLRFDDNAYTSQSNCINAIPDTLHQNFYSVSAHTPFPGYTPYVNKEQWYCIAYTYDGTVGNFYVDGILQASESTPGLSFINSYDLFLGRMNNSQFSYWFNGVMDEIRMYNRAINAQEVQSICETSVLPLSITKFEANVINKQIKLNWNLDIEEGTKYYTIERSLTGVSDFISLRSIMSKNIHSYSYIDNTAAINQTYYYRLAIIDNTGAVSYSQIKTARIGKNKFIVVYPNPSKGTIIVKLNDYSGKAKFSITNTLGQIVFEKTSNVSNNSPIQLVLNNKVKGGVFWLEVETANEKSIEKIMVF